PHSNKTINRLKNTSINQLKKPELQAGQLKTRRHYKQKGSQDRANVLRETAISSPEARRLTRTTPSRRTPRYTEPPAASPRFPADS
ncbi:hypothetical protein, partial [Burkholderia pseudomallei]|uniref:hypothetical protein n=1 Tax=Burkholderia pseudomallei TaxID=28450 RepID=UPI001E3CD8D0